MHPAAGLVGALGDVGVNVVGHAGGERDDVVVRHFLNLVDLLNGEVGVIADPLGLLARDARQPSSAWASQARTSISFQMANLFSSSQMRPISGRV